MTTSLVVNEYSLDFTEISHFITISHAFLRNKAHLIKHFKYDIFIYQNNCFSCQKSLCENMCVLSLEQNDLLAYFYIISMQYILNIDKFSCLRYDN